MCIFKEYPIIVYLIQKFKIRNQKKQETERDNYDIWFYAWRHKFSPREKKKTQEQVASNYINIKYNIYIYQSRNEESY